MITFYTDCPHLTETYFFEKHGQFKVSDKEWDYPYCCDMGKNDTIGKIELNPSIVLSSDNTNCKNDIQLFYQLFDELSVYRDYH